VVDKEFFNPGKGAAVVRLKLKGLKSGNVVREVLKTDELVEEINVDHRPAQFLYFDGNHYVFMNPKTYEQYQVEPALVADYQGLIKEGQEYQLALYQDRVVGLRLPKKMVFEVIETEKAVKGDTVTGATKPAKLDTGLIIKVPLFVKKGDQIIVNTETGEYVSRKND